MTGKTYAEFLAALRDDYGRPSRPPFAVSYRHCWALAHQNGWDIPSLSTARRLVAMTGGAQ